MGKDSMGLTKRVRQDISGAKNPDVADIGRRRRGGERGEFSHAEGCSTAR